MRGYAPALFTSPIYVKEQLFIYPIKGVFVPITEKQYKNIKEQVLNRLKNENPFQMYPDEFCNQFNIEPPFYRDLVQHVKNDGMPFHTDARWKNASGEPSEPIVFSLL